MRLLLCKRILLKKLRLRVAGGGRDDRPFRKAIFQLADQLRNRDFVEGSFAPFFDVRAPFGALFGNLPRIRACPPVARFAEGIDELPRNLT
ncbi:hypothetical protein SDC9_179052 [bioreactor metagenome]|uniref:Uncharacterized protein n=1 Tax=bioreactor metagenome TaxID=1076179 RepID=A0A645GXX1_9ZZZZ